MITAISAAVAAVAFVVLVVFVIRFLLLAGRSLTSVDGTLLRIRKELETVSEHSVGLLTASEKLVKQADEKLQALEPMARSVRQTGEALEQVSTSVRQVSAAVSRSASGIGDSMERGQSRVAEVAEFVSMGMHLWQKWQSHRNAKHETKTQVQSKEE